MLDRLARAVIPSLLTSTLLGACYITPYNGQLVGDSSFSVIGYTDTPSSLVVIEVLNETGGWEQIGATTSEASPAYPAGSLTPNNPDLYRFSTNVQVVDPADPSTDRRWAWGWWTELRMRNLTTGQALYGGEDISLGCFFNAPLASSDFYALSYDCGWDTTTISLLRQIP